MDVERCIFEFFSSTNAKKWEVELQTLRNTNERLTAAIQESANNVDLWNKQLTSLKEENARLKMKVSRLIKYINQSINQKSLFPSIENNIRI